MATSRPPSSTTPTPQQQAHMRDSFESFIHNASMAMIVVAPILIALPPRKLDLYTFMLGGAFIAGANQLTKEHTGFGLLQTLAGRRKDDIQTQREELERKIRGTTQQVKVMNAKVRKWAEEHESERKPVSKLEEKAKEIWMGGETEGWKERRLKEEQEKISRGEGYGSMITDQIWEVWNWGEKKGEDLVEKDKAVLKQRQREREFPKIGKD